MPEGGFIEHAHARKGNIIIAHEKLNLSGYLMFRLVNRHLRVTIVHLCIKEEYRGQNISTKLLDTLRERYKHSYSGISLSCRTDYTHATKLWQRYGFIFQRQERSRSVNEKYINKWWYDFNLPDLFSIANDASIKIKALLDSNIIFKLRDEEDSFSDISGVSTLLSDWLSDEVEYFYSPEIKNEFLRDKNKERIEKTKAYISRFNETRFDIESSKAIAKKLKSIITGNNENDESDRNQIASCIASGMPYFITLDDGILSKKDEIESEYDVLIFNPHGFYLEIDQLINKELYSPKKLAGVTSHEIKKFGSDDFNHCIDMFLVKSLSEKRSEFIDCINSALSSDNSEIKVIQYESSHIALFSLKYTNKILFVQFIRVLEKYKNKLTLFIQIIYGLINESIKKGVSQIVIFDKYILEYQKVILNKLGFVFMTNSWTKQSLNLIADSSNST